MWTGKAPKQTTPGVGSVTQERYNPKTGELETSTVEYDQYGRMIKRIDNTDHGYPQNHSNPHTHEYEYTSATPGGKETRKNK